MPGSPSAVVAGRIAIVLRRRAAADVAPPAKAAIEADGAEGRRCQAVQTDCAVPPVVHRHSLHEPCRIFTPQAVSRP